VRRAIILLSDGEDNLSHVTREEAIDMATRADVIVYTISTNISGMKARATKRWSASPKRPADAHSFPSRCATCRFLLSIQRNSAASTRSLTSLRILSPMTLPFDRYHGSR